MISLPFSFFFFIWQAITIQQVQLVKEEEEIEIDNSQNVVVKSESKEKIQFTFVSFSVCPTVNNWDDAQLLRKMMMKIKKKTEKEKLSSTVETR